MRTLIFIFIIYCIIMFEEIYSTYTLDETAGIVIYSLILICWWICVIQDFKELIK